MKTTLKLIAPLLACSTTLSAKTEIPDKKPRIEVCFVLDTTGSMGGLIEGAKQKIWSIANEMISAKPTPELKLGLDRLSRQRRRLRSEVISHDGRH